MDSKFLRRSQLAKKIRSPRLSGICTILSTDILIMVSTKFHVQIPSHCEKFLEGVLNDYTWVELFSHANTYSNSYLQMKCFEYASKSSNLSYSARLPLELMTYFVSSEHLLCTNDVLASGLLTWSKSHSMKHMAELFRFVELRVCSPTVLASLATLDSMDVRELVLKAFVWQTQNTDVDIKKLGFSTGSMTEVLIRQTGFYTIVGKGAPYYGTRYHSDSYYGGQTESYTHPGDNVAAKFELKQGDTLHICCGSPSRNCGGGTFVTLKTRGKCKLMLVAGGGAAENDLRHIQETSIEIDESFLPPTSQHCNLTRTGAFVSEKSSERCSYVAPWAEASTFKPIPGDEAAVTINWTVGQKE